MILELPTQKSGKYKAVSGANLGSQGVMNLTQCDYVRSTKSALTPLICVVKALSICDCLNSLGNEYNIWYDPGTIC